MTKLSRIPRALKLHQQKLSSKSRKFTLWLPGLALAAGGLTLAQAGHLKATPAANGAFGTSVKVNAARIVRAKSISIPVGNFDLTELATNIAGKSGSTNANRRFSKNIPVFDGYTKLNIKIASSGSNPSTGNTTHFNNTDGFFRS